MTSTSGLIGNLAQANYSAAKLGITALSKSLALDLKRWNIRSNCIAPFAWSRMTSSIKVDSPEQEERVNRMKEMVPNKIAPLALHLASDAGADTTGQIFAVRNNEIFLMSQPRPVRSVHRGEGWTIEDVASHAIPALKRSYVPLEVSADVFLLGSDLNARFPSRTEALKTRPAKRWAVVVSVSVNGINSCHFGMVEISFRYLNYDSSLRIVGKKQVNPNDFRRKPRV